MSDPKEDINAEKSGLESTDKNRNKLSLWLNRGYILLHFQQSITVRKDTPVTELFIINVFVKCNVHQIASYKHI